jgi:hypothetical protein
MIVRLISVPLHFREAGFLALSFVKKVPTKHSQVLRKRQE